MSEQVTREQLDGTLRDYVTKQALEQELRIMQLAFEKELRETLKEEMEPVLNGQRRAIEKIEEAQRQSEKRQQQEDQRRIEEAQAPPPTQKWWLNPTVLILAGVLLGAVIVMLAVGVITPADIKDVAE